MTRMELDHPSKRRNERNLREKEPHDKTTRMTNETTNRLRAKGTFYTSNNPGRAKGDTERENQDKDNTDVKPELPDLMDKLTGQGQMGA